MTPTSGPDKRRSYHWQVRIITVSTMLAAYRKMCCIVTGNPRRDLWKKTAWDMSNCTSLTPQERAIYSSLCGNSKQLVTSGVCCSWEDLLWALCKGMVDKLVEEELRRTIPRSYLDMPKEYWENEDKLENVFEALRRLHKK